MKPTDESMFSFSESPSSAAVLEPGSLTVQSNTWPFPFSPSSPMPSQLLPFSTTFTGPSSSSSPFLPSFMDLESNPNVSKLNGPVIGETVSNGPIGTLNTGLAAMTAATILSSGGKQGNLDVPQPLEPLQNTSIPPFLWKTFDLVDDPTLEQIISWGHTGKSFVVWDPVEFARRVLPQYFKHNNFASFVRQLNAYGFQKVDSDKWEFANESFIRGKRHLLKSIQRRKLVQALQHVGNHAGSFSESEKTELADEIEGLRKEKASIMQEVVELQQQHLRTLQHVVAMNQKIQAAEQTHKQMVSFLAKLFQNPMVLARLHRRNKEQTAIASPRTTRKLINHQDHELGNSVTFMGFGAQPKNITSKELPVNPQQEAFPPCVVSFPENLAEE